MSGRKKRKNLAGLPSEISPEDRDVVTRLTAEHKGAVHECLEIMQRIVASKRAAAEAMNIELDSVHAVDAPSGVEDDDAKVAEMLTHIAYTNRRMEVAEVMASFLTSVGSNASTRKGKYKVSTPLMTPADVHPFLREPLAEGETPCIAGNLCYTHKIPGWPVGRKLRSLVLPGETRFTGYCIVCHDFLVYKFIIKQDQESPHRRFVDDPAGAGATQVQGYPAVVNDVQYLFGPGGYKPSIRMTQMDLKPIHGVVGQVKAPSLGHYAPYEEDGIWRLSDEACHFPSPSA